LADIRTLCRTIVPLNLDTHSNALIVASAPGAGCDTVWSEGMQHGAGIEGRLHIINPF
jgi:predicted nucleic acid-binding protein